MHSLNKGHFRGSFFFVRSVRLVTLSHPEFYQPNIPPCQILTSVSLRLLLCQHMTARSTPALFLERALKIKYCITALHPCMNRISCRQQWMQLYRGVLAWQVAWFFFFLLRFTADPQLPWTFSESFISSVRFSRFHICSDIRTLSETRGKRKDRQNLSLYISIFHVLGLKEYAQGLSECRLCGIPFFFCEGVCFSVSQKKKKKIKCSEMSLYSDILLSCSRRRRQYTKCTPTCIISTASPLVTSPFPQAFFFSTLTVHSEIVS